MHILESEETGTFSLNKQDINTSVNLQHMEECYNDINTLIKDITGPLGLKTCLHPSEYDRTHTLLPCRSEAALRNDIIGRDRSISEQKLLIPLSSLCRLENVKITKGRFSKLWIARWSRSGSKDKEDVVVKELSNPSNNTQLQPFMRMCDQATKWNDSTLIKIYGIMLPTPGSQMALVMEYLPKGILF